MRLRPPSAGNHSGPAAAPRRDRGARPVRQREGPMRTKVRYAIGTVFAAVLTAGAATAQPFTMRLSSPTVNDVTHEWMKAFKAGVESRAPGQIKVEIYPANQLGQIP